MAKLKKQQIKNLGIILVALVVAYWFWQGRAKTHEHGGTAMKEHGGKEHAGKEHGGKPVKEHAGKEHGGK